jgi:acetoin utilization deacetylase AcuC-like enzyme
MPQVDETNVEENPDALVLYGSAGYSANDQDAAGACIFQAITNLAEVAKKNNRRVLWSTRWRLKSNATSRTR